MPIADGFRGSHLRSGPQGAQNFFAHSDLLKECTRAANTLRSALAKACELKAAISGRTMLVSALLGASPLGCGLGRTGAFRCRRWWTPICGPAWDWAQPVWDGRWYRGLALLQA